MSQARDVDPDLIDKIQSFLKKYYREEIAALAQKYPSEQKSLVVDYQDIFKWDSDAADDFLNKPERMVEYAEEALRLLELPVDESLSKAHVRVENIPSEQTFYPGEFSPTDHSGSFRAIRGEVSRATDVFARATTVAFECQRCGTLTRISQSGGDFEEPHECTGCERQGPFLINEDQTDHVDAQMLRVQTPPEEAQGTGQELDVAVEDDLAGVVTAGDRVTIPGKVTLEQQSSDRSKDNVFEPFLDAIAIEVDETDAQDIDITAEERQEITALANGDEGDPLEVAAESLHPKVHGYETQKEALILAVVGGATNTPGLRGEMHVLFIGDPSTAKSELINRVADIAPRSVSVSAKSASSAGLTSTATQGEFSGGRWTLQPGAFVKANEGVLCIDELDDMDPDDRKSMLEPMANQQINVSKAGINATLTTQTGVLAAANPKHSRFDPFKALDEQFGFESNLISRFDLVYTFRDQPDEDDDSAVAGHVTQYRDAKIRRARGLDLTEDQAEIVDTPVDDETLRLWLTLAKRQPDPVYESDDVRQQLEQSFVSLRGANGYEEDGEVPVTYRKLPGIERVARAHAKLEFSEVITERHARQAMAMVGQSLQDYQKTEDGTLDADIGETGQSQSQRERRQQLARTIQELQRDTETGQVPADDLLEALGHDDRSQLEHDIEHLRDQGAVIRKQNGDLRYIGGA